MDFDFLRLKPLRPLRLGDNLLTPSLRRLNSITKNFPPPGEPPLPRLAEVRKRVRYGFQRKLPFEQYTDFPRRETILLHLYSNDLHREEDRQFLPPFDEAVASSLLGGKKSKVRRELASRLFLTHFGEERIPCLCWLAEWLRTAWKAEYFEKQTGDISPYITNAETLFSVDSPEKVANERLQGESIEELLLRFKIPDASEFKDRLFEELVLCRLRTTPHNKIESDLEKLVIESKTKILINGYALGAEAVKILIKRTIKEFDNKVPPAWRDLFVGFACDPRTLNKVELSRWWGWATNQEKQIACNALIQWCLDEFLDQLQESLESDREQFEYRKDLLLSIVETGRAIDVRLVVNNGLFKKLDKKIHENLNPKKTKDSHKNISFICLKCIDNVFLVEGTSKFALRGFIGDKKFPVIGLWDNVLNIFSESSFRAHKDKCDIYVKHQGPPHTWKWKFMQQLSEKNIEWRNLYRH